MTRVRCRFDHAGATPAAVELVGRRGELEARRLSDVVPLLTEVEQASRSGLYAAGFVAYEAAPAFDPALAVPSGPPPGPVPAADLPLAWFGLFADARPVDPLVRVVPAPAGGGEPGDAGGDWPGRPGTRWSCETGSGEHADAVERIRSAIVDGDTYLVNLTTRFRRPWSEEDDPFVLYRRLVAGHSGGHHAYLETPEWAVACGSPELFFELRQGRLTTRPMKGTAPRGRWAEEDVARSEALRCSAKERAENVMVVDLLRNDLGRIAVPGSVAVPELWQVERHPTVWQLTSTVVARPRAGVGLAEVFGAVFPSGSVTGAPKVSAMSIIAELERSPRGVYCGAVGLVEPVGDRSPAAAAGRDGPPDDIVAHFAVAIRTAVVDKGRQVVEYGSGGGITWDSSVRAEWDEVLVKTRALADPGPLAGGVGLIETMGFFPQRARGNEGDDRRARDGIRNLDDHLARLASSAAALGLPPPVGAADRIADAVVGLPAPARIRLVLHPDGRLDVATSPLGPEDLRERTLVLCIDHDPVGSGDPGLFHKTTDRRRYDERARRHGHADDVLLVNERDEVTETTRANVAVLVGGEWWTPPLECGLLPGVERAGLIADGKVVERVVTVEQLLEADQVATFSSLRGWRAARVLHRCPSSGAG